MIHTECVRMAFFNLYRRLNMLNMYVSLFTATDREGKYTRRFRADAILLF